MKNLLPYLFPKIARLPAARNIITRALCDTGERARLDNPFQFAYLLCADGSRLPILALTP
jgi:hypothetical protein